MHATGRRRGPPHVRTITAGRNHVQPSRPSPSSAVRDCHASHSHGRPTIPAPTSGQWQWLMGPAQLTLRTRPGFERFSGGPEMAEPGVVPLPDWHGPGSGYPIPCYAGMGRKP